MEVIVDVRDADMSKSKKHSRRAIRQQRRKKQLTWKGWWRRKILNEWYHCKTRCNCLKVHFNSPLSACFSQLSQLLLSAVKRHPTAQRGTNITGSKKIKQSFQDGNLDLLTSHCSHVIVAALLSRAVTQPVLTLGRAGTFVSDRSGRQQNSYWWMCYRSSFLFASWHKKHDVALFWREEVTNPRNFIISKNHSHP